VTKSLCAEQKDIATFCQEASEGRGSLLTLTRPPRSDATWISRRQRMLRHENHSGAMPEPPTPGRGNSVEVPDERNRTHGDVAEGRCPTEERVVQVDANFARRREAISSACLQPVRTERLDRIVRSQEVVLDELPLRDDGTICIGAVCRRAMQRTRRGEHDDEERYQLAKCGAHGKPPLRSNAIALGYDEAGTNGPQELRARGLDATVERRRGGRPHGVRAPRAPHALRVR
jgi:hypothetical protein